MAIHRFIARLGRGRARCVREPRDGERGLEGYNRGDDYRFDRCRGDKGTYIRVYPEPEDGPSPDYFEVCGPDIFLRYFEVVEEIRCA